MATISINEAKKILKENAVIELHPRIEEDITHYSPNILNRLLEICKEMGTKDGFTLKFTALNYDQEQDIVSITRSTTMSHIGG